MLRVAFAGLPSAGKSTMINALAGARFLETGVCRTTRAPCVLGSDEPEHALKCGWKRATMRSDDGVALCVVDLPGICDAENTGKEENFTELTMQWAAHCDVIVWVTDVRTCFLTSHEKLEYEKLKGALDKVAVETGRLFQFCVVLAKCDVDIVSVGAQGSNAAKSGHGAQRCAQHAKTIEGEIVTPYEETTVADCVVRAKKLFPGEHIVAFNAFGRIIARNSSEALKALAAQLAPNSRNVNTEFNMKWATTNLPEKRQAQLLRSIVAALTSGPALNKDGLPGDWTTRLDIQKNKQYYVNPKTGATQWERPQAPRGSESAGILNRELVDGLDESTTAMLVLLVLGVDAGHLRSLAAWHTIVVCAGPDAKGLSSKSAERIGLLKHGPSAAQKHEAVIKRYVGNNMQALVEAMMHMCGPTCIVTSRMYFRLPFLGTASNGILKPPSTMSAVPTASPRYPEMLELDVQHNTDRVIGMSVPWVEKVKAARVRLWGHTAERDVCVTTVIALVREQLLPSVLSLPVCT
jgi:hypothetical protein